MILWFLASIIVGGTCARNAIYTKNAYANRHRPSPHRQNYFDAELFEVLAREKEGNVVISPLSIKLALGMIMLGASGKSADEIQASLRLPNQDTAEVFKEILSSVKGSTTNDLQIASRIFVPLESRINLSYQKSLMEIFDSGVTPLSFKDPERAYNVINKWVAEATYGLIPKISERHQIDPSAKLIVANAVYFKGKWQSPFLRQKTTRKCFYSYRDQCVNVSMMIDSGQFDFGYVPKLDAYAINLPYEGKRFSMLLVLPQKKHGHKQLSLDLLHVGLDEIMSQLVSQEVHVEIPRFTIKTETDLIPTLTRLGISQIFGARAELSNIFESSGEPVSVSRVFHSAKIIVDEEGVESAAASGSFFVPLMGGSVTTFIADHPFLFFIRDVVTGTVLFSGKIERPEQEEVVASGIEQSALNAASKGFPVQTQAQAPSGFAASFGNDRNIPKPIRRVTSAGRPASPQRPYSATTSQTRYQDSTDISDRQRTEPVGYLQAYPQQTLPTTNYNPSYQNPNRMYFRA